MCVDLKKESIRHHHRPHSNPLCIINSTPHSTSSLLVRLTLLVLLSGGGRTTTPRHRDQGSDTPGSVRSEVGGFPVNVRGRTCGAPTSTPTKASVAVGRPLRYLSPFLYPVASPISIGVTRPLRVSLSGTSITGGGRFPDPKSGPVRPRDRGRT